MSDPEIKWDAPVRMTMRADPFTLTRTIWLEGRAYGKSWVISAEWDDAWGDAPPSGVAEDLYRRLCAGIILERARPAPEVGK